MTEGKQPGLVCVWQLLAVERGTESGSSAPTARISSTLDAGSRALRSVKDRLFEQVSPVQLFAPLEDDLGRFSARFVGNVLNAGAGDRDVSSTVRGRLFNQDLPEGRHNRNIHFFGPLHAIPVADRFFDGIICNAVLEHVENPEEVMREFARVTKPGATLYLGVPFLAPEHLDPTDFQRYTSDGLQRLMERHGFAVERLEGMGSVYTTLGWIIMEWLGATKHRGALVVKVFLYPALRMMSRRSKKHVHSIASYYRAIGVRMHDVDVG